VNPDFVHDKSPAMLCAVTSQRARVITGLLAVSALLAACSSTTDGSGNASGSPHNASSPDFPSGSVGGSSDAASPPVTPPVTPTGSTPTGLPSGSPPAHIHQVPADPLKTVTVHAPDGTTYVVKLWAEVQNDTCFDHAYGKPIREFLTKHPCDGMTRYLGTTTVGGRPVGFAETSTGFTGTAKDPYVNSGAFRQLVEKDGTGSINDLLREGYRLPSGPAQVPSPDAFNCVGQDNGVTVWDVWYLDGSTPNNAKPLVQMTMDLFLQY
jgi:hypothetical protein